MAQTSRAQLETELAEVIAAISAVRLGQSYSIGDRSLTRVDLDQLTADRQRLVRELAALDAEDGGASSPGVAIATWE